MQCIGLQRTACWGGFAGLPTGQQQIAQAALAQPIGTLRHVGCRPLPACGELGGLPGEQCRPVAS